MGSKPLTLLAAWLSVFKPINVRSRTLVTVRVFRLLCEAYSHFDAFNVPAEYMRTLIKNAQPGAGEKAL